MIPLVFAAVLPCSCLPVAVPGCWGCVLRQCDSERRANATAAVQNQECVAFRSPFVCRNAHWSMCRTEGPTNTWLDDDDEQSLVELFQIFTGADVRRRRIARPFRQRLRTFCWRHVALPLWQGCVVCIGTLALKKWYLENV